MEAEEARWLLRQLGWADGEVHRFVGRDDGVGLDFLGVLSVCSGAVHHFEINGALGNASQRNPVIEKLLPVIRNWTKVDDGGLIAGVGADDRLLSAVQNLAGVAAGGVDRDVAV